MAAVGFDLDMTLVDSRPVSRRALERLVAEGHRALDVTALMDAYGVPVDRWLPTSADVARFRRLQHEEVGAVEALPGARAALDAVRGHGWRAAVISAAPADLVAAMLRHAGLDVDAVHGDVWATGKVAPLARERCWAFVGDHADDMAAARAAGAVAVGVATGTTVPADCDVLLADLTHLPGWIAAQRGLSGR
jgi:phosphoglycolate phosphatase-like HAD superfamily hydrolase